MVKFCGHCIYFSFFFLPLHARTFHTCSRTNLHVNTCKYCLPELMGFSETVTKDLNDISERKAEDEKEEAEFQAVVGPRPISQVVAAMWKELETMATYHKQGVS